MYDINHEQNFIKLHMGHARACLASHFGFQPYSSIKKPTLHAAIMSAKTTCTIITYTLTRWLHVSTLLTIIRSRQNIYLNETATAVHTEVLNNISVSQKPG
jgi:hypothetical protein